MIEHPTLFDLPPNVRNGNPATSSIAARRIAKSGKRVKNAAIVERLVVRSPGLTAHELWYSATPEEQADLREVETVKKRLSDLASAGVALIVRGQPRECSIRQTMMTTWYPAPRK
jgi:hypothetical protein